MAKHGRTTKRKPARKPRTKARGDAARKLNERERRFVEFYMGAAKGNATKAAILAGYSKKTAAQIASRLLRKVNIQDAIARRATVDPAVADRVALQAFWTKVMNDAKGDMKDRLTASALQAKALAMFIHKIEIIPPHKLSEETIRRALAESEGSDA